MPTFPRPRAKTVEDLLMEVEAVKISDENFRFFICDTLLGILEALRDLNDPITAKR